MTTKSFIEQLKKTITIEGHTLMLGFFITFSRFESALKTLNFSIGDADKASANWNILIASIRPIFNKGKTLAAMIEKTVINKCKKQYMY